MPWQAAALALVRAGRSLAELWALRHSTGMSICWLSGFVIGALLARLGVSWNWLVSCMNHWVWSWLIAFFMWRLGFGLRLASRCLVAILGVLWGLGHAAPAVKLRDVFVVVAQDVEDDWPGPVLARSMGRSTNILAEVRAPRRPGEVITASPLGEPDLLGQQRVTMGRVSVYNPQISQFNIAGSVRAVRGYWLRASATIREPVRSWVRGIVLGDANAMPAGLRRDFLLTGLTHLLAVSGLQVSLFALWVNVLLNLPLRLLYSTRLLSPGVFHESWAALRLLSAAAAIGYCLLTGASQACQRAALVHCGWQLAPVFLGCMPILRQLSLVAVLQSLIFPIGFLSTGNLMSWAAYLLIISAGSRNYDWPEAGRAIIGLQFKFLALTGALFGQLPIMGIVANILLVPIFPLIFCAAAAAPWWSKLAELGGILWQLQSSYLQLVRFLAEIAKSSSIITDLAVAIPDGVRLCCIAATLVILLNSALRLSIRSVSWEADDASQSMARKVRCGG